MGLDFQPVSEPVNIGRPLDLQVGVWVLSVRCLSPIHHNDAYRRDGFVWIPHTCLPVYPCACHKGAVSSSTPYAHTYASFQSEHPGVPSASGTIPCLEEPPAAPKPRTIGVTGDLLRQLPPSQRPPGKYIYPIGRVKCTAPLKTLHIRGAMAPPPFQEASARIARRTWPPGANFPPRG